MGFLATALLVVVLFILSLIETSINRLSQVSLKVLAEKEDHRKIDLLENIARDRSHFLLPLQFGIQLVQVITAVIVTTLCLVSELPYAAGWALLIMVAVIALFRQIIPKMITHGNPERILLGMLPFFSNGYGVLRWLSSPLVAVLRLTYASRDRNIAESQDEEATEEEIQAYVGLGEEEGIIEEEESELILSALEFGDTLAREIMTPRMEIVAIEESSTLADLKKLMISSKHSRLPVYRGSIDHIVGVVYLRHVLAYLEEGRLEDPITPLINRPMFVPATKRVLELLKEMQRDAEHLAIVVSEFGAVSGLVSMEDLVEEIVGEIRDEDEQLQTDLIREAEGSYVVGGRVEIDRLEDALGVDLGDPDASTVSGLVVGHLGRVPAAGETVILNGMQVEIVSAGRRRIHSLRVRKVEARAGEPGIAK